METTQLTVIQRAAAALGSSKAETELTALALQSQSITAVTSADGRTECHAAAMLAKSARIGIEKAGKAARDDATQFSKAVIAEEKRLVALIEPEESRLITMRDAWDSEIAREKAAKAEAERLAILEITTRIANIRAWPMLAVGASSAAVLDDIERLEALPIDDSFKRFYGEAAEAKADSLAKLRSIHAAQARAEEEAIRIQKEQEEQLAKAKAEREELARQRAEQEAKIKAEREELQRQRENQEALQKRLDAERDAKQAAEKVERDAEFHRLTSLREEIAETQRLLAAERQAKEESERKAYKCDGNHGGPKCADPECWNGGVPVMPAEAIAVDAVASLQAVEYAPASETDMSKSVSMRIWIAKMLYGMTLDELDVVRASVEFVLSSRKSAA